MQQEHSPGGSEGLVNLGSGDRRVPAMRPMAV